MKKVALSLLLVVLLLPASAYAGGSRYGRGTHGYRHGHNRHHTVVIKSRHPYPGGAIAASVLGGVITGVIIDRVLFPPPPPPPQVVYYPAPTYRSPTPPAPRRPENPYNRGYREGYESGYQKGYSEYYKKRHEEGREKGYEEGYEKGRLGKIRESPYSRSMPLGGMRIANF